MENYEKRTAMVKNGIVENISLWDWISHFDPGPDYVLVNVDAQPTVDRGWVFDGTDFSAPPQPARDD